MKVVDIVDIIEYVNTINIMLKNNIKQKGQLT